MSRSRSPVEAADDALEGDEPPTTWTSMLAPASVTAPADPRRALERVARAIQAGVAVGRDDAAWFVPAVLEYCDPRPSSRGASLDALLGLAPPIATRAIEPSHELRRQRDQQLRFVAHGLPGSEWRKATTLAALVHGTGLAPTPELQEIVGGLRAAHGDALPAGAKQYARILRRGESDDVGHE